MKRLFVPLSFVMVAGLSVASHAETPASVTTSADNSCRKIITAKDHAGTVYCGNAQQWAELDRRIAQINAGVTCRVVMDGKERCMKAAEWKQYERQVANLRGSGLWGPDGQNDYRPDFSSNMAGAASEQMAQNQMQQQQYNYAAQMAQVPVQPSK